jgi:hypothetical protein
MNKFFSDILDKIIVEIKKKENMSKIETNLVDPLISYTFNKLYPYLIIVSVIFLLTFLLALFILLLQIKGNKFFKSASLNNIITI